MVMLFAINTMGFVMYKKVFKEFLDSRRIRFIKRYIIDWNKLNSNEQFYIKNILAFFAKRSDYSILIVKNCYYW